MLCHVRFHSLFNFTQKLTPEIGRWFWKTPFAHSTCGGWGGCGAWRFYFFYLWNLDEERGREGEVLKSSYRMGQTLKGDQILCGGMNPIDTVFINCTLLSFKMQLIFPGLEYIGILSIHLLLTRCQLHYSSSHCNSCLTLAKLPFIEFS